MDTLREFAGNINIEGGVVLGAPMKDYTSFRIGGPADILAEPRDTEEVVKLLALAEELSIPWFVLGDGANILVSDKGIRGLVIRTAALRSVTVDGTRLEAGAGLPMTEAAAAAAAAGLSGLEFIYSMPGSVGGSVWMNARCFDRSISEALKTVTYVTRGGRDVLTVECEDFGYKTSPFQTMDAIITSAEFLLSPANKEEILQKQERVKEERKAKGHFLFPSAGSVFKNNRALGEPAGKIIESLGLKGTRIGDAQIADFHGNIIVNLGGAKASDVRALVERAEDAVRRAYGFSLEREVLFVGEW